MDWEPILEDIKDDFPLDSKYVESKRTRMGPVTRIIEREVEKGDQLLSVGSGPCVTESVLSRMGYEVTAVDELEDKWAKLGNNQQRLQEFANRNGVEFYKRTMSPENTLPKSDFDLVFSLDVIEHLTMPRRFLNSCVYHIRDNGTLFLLTPNAARLARRVKRLVGRPRNPSSSRFYWNIGEFRGHIKEYTMGEIEQILSYHNMRRIKIDTIHQLVKGKKVSTDSTINRIIIDIYKNIAGIHPSFKDTIITTAEKPSEWEPITDDVERFINQRKLVRDSNIDGLSNTEIYEDIT